MTATVIWRLFYHEKLFSKGPKNGVNSENKEKLPKTLTLQHFADKVTSSKFLTVVQLFSRDTGSRVENSIMTIVDAAMSTKQENWPFCVLKGPF